MGLPGVLPGKVQIWLLRFLYEGPIGIKDSPAQVKSMRENSFAINALNPSPTKFTQNIHRSHSFSAGYWIIYPHVITKRVIMTDTNLIA